MQTQLLYLLAVHLTTYCTNGRSIRVKREFDTESNFNDWYLRLFRQLHPQEGISTTNLDDLFKNDPSSNVTIFIEPSAAPPMVPTPDGNDNVIVGSVAEDDDMNDALPGQNQTEILNECKMIPVKDLRDICIRVATNPILKTMRGVRAYAATQSRFTTARGFSTSGPTIKQVICTAKDKRCPVYQRNSLGHFPGIRSLSPWTMCHEFDPDRFPQWLNKAECLCEGCISATDGREDRRDVFSQLLSVDIAVLRKDNSLMDFRQCTRQTCREGVESISIGCHCALAKIVSAT